MKLNDLDVEDLQSLMEQIGFLQIVGGKLQEVGLDARFDLTPGQRARVILPPLDMVPGFDLLDELKADLDHALSVPAHDDDDGEAHFAELEAHFAELEAHFAALEAQDDAEPGEAIAAEAVADLIADGVREIIPYFQAAEQPPQPQPTPDSASALAQQAFARFWTPERDADLIESVAFDRIAGLTWSECYARAATKIPNTPKSMELRARQHLRGRIEARISDLTEAAPAPTPEPEPAPADAQAGTEVAGAIPSSTPATAPDAAAVSVPDAATPGPAAPKAVEAATGPAPTAGPTDELGAYLWRMTRNGDWDISADHELMELACLSWPLGDVATQMGRDSKVVKARFELLTLGRKYKSRDVLDRLTQFLAAE